MLKTEKYDRRPFSVVAVQVNFNNYRKVAEWCKGTVVMQKTKMLGVETEVPAVRVDGQGDNRGKSFVASLGCYIVELKGSFRVYKPAQFESAFVKVEEGLVGDTVLDKALQEAQNLSNAVEDGCTECTDDTQHRIHVLRMQAEADYAAGDNSSVDGQETASAHFA